MLIVALLRSLATAGTVWITFDAVSRAYGGA
jgi:hypothetical protein